MSIDFSECSKINVNSFIEATKEIYSILFQKRPLKNSNQSIKLNK